MASTVLPNGIIIPEKYSRDWYNDLYHNWQELDNLLGGGTPKDGTLTIQKNGTTVGTFSANQATDETINITVPDVNDATLTIQKNGTTVDTFTANSSTDKTVNIAVPTKTSDLTNDSGFITEDNTKIPLAGSNQISGDLIPSTDNSIDIGSSTNNIKMLYTKGITIDGTQFLPSDYIPRSGGAVITGNSLGKNTDGGDLRITGGSDFNKGGSVIVYGKDRIDENGKVVLHAADGSNEAYFSFYPDGYITFGSNFSFNTNVIFQIGSSEGIYLQLRYDGMILSNSNVIYPANHLITDLGSSANAWNNIYLGNAPIIVSDSRAKTQTQDVDDKLLDAWSNVEIKTYKMVSAVEKKGEKARYHIGYIAQDIQAECEKQGVNASEYGLFCYDEWEEQEEVSEEIETKKDGKKVKEKRVIQPKREKGNSYALRYEEALVVECKYLRRCVERLTARIEELEKENNSK